MAIIKSLPKTALQVIEAYFNLKAAENKYVRCPYFRNPLSGRERWGLAVYAGKGSPIEIEEELKIIEKLEDANFSKMHEDEIRDIMKKRKLGVECSGFITNVLDAWTRGLYRKPMHRFIHFKRNGLGWLFCKMRPYTHIDVETLVHRENAREINNINEIMPGDLIRFNSEIDHAVLVTGIEREENGVLKKAHYAQSVLEESREGVKRGHIEFVNLASCDLLSQSWREEPETGHTIVEKGTPKIYRLHILE